MKVTQSFRNYLLKLVNSIQGLITYQDFSRISEDPYNPKFQILSLSQVLDASIRSNPIGTNYSEISQRVHKSYQNYIREKALQSSIDVKILSETKNKLRLFYRWMHCPQATNDRFSSYSYVKDITQPLSINHSESVRSRSFSVKSEAQQLLSSSSSKPILQSRLEYDTSLSQKSRQTSPFNRLYNHAASKEAALENNRSQAFIKKMEECTFHPKVISDIDRTGNVFERLHQSGIVQRENPPIKFNEYKEIQECTFSPQINPPKQKNADRPFDKLYNDAEIQRKKIMEKELKQKQTEFIDCTFRPNINGNTGQVTVGNVYEKLYNNFQEIQKQRIKKQVQGKDKDEAEVQFVPKLMAQGDGIGRYTRVNVEVDRKKVVIEKERSSSAPRRKKSDEVPRFEHLYALHKDKQDRHLVLQERFLKESGVVFKPNLVKSGTPKSKKREFSPKLAYPLPKNPNSDSALSSYN